MDGGCEVIPDACDEEAGGTCLIMCRRATHRMVTFISHVLLKLKFSFQLNFIQFEFDLGQNDAADRCNCCGLVGRRFAIATT